MKIGERTNVVELALLNPGDVFFFRDGITEKCFMVVDNVSIADEIAVNYLPPTSGDIDFNHMIGVVNLADGHYETYESSEKVIKMDNAKIVF